MYKKLYNYNYLHIYFYFISRRKYGSVEASRNHKTGSIFFSERGGRKIYYLITKNRYYQKPKYRNIFQCLKRLRNDMLSRGINRIALPKIACGRDRKNWRIIEKMLSYLFHETEIDITIYFY